LILRRSAKRNDLAAGRAARGKFPQTFDRTSILTGVSGNGLFPSIEADGEFMITASLARLAGSIAIAACLVATFSLPAAAQELKAWRHSIIAPKADAGFFYMAAKRGFFEREGLKVETLEVKDDAIGIKALLSGEVDSHEGTAGAIAAVARGADVKILGCPWHGVPYVLLARPGITSMEQLRGKAIASSSPGTPPEMMARASLALFKIDPSEVKLAAVGGDRDRYAALLGGVVDAAVVSNEYTPLPQTKNLKVLVEGKQALPKSVRFCVQMTGKTIATRWEDAIRFMMAQMKAWHYAVAHRDETIKVTMEATDAKADDPRPAFIFDDAVNNGIVKPDFPIPVENLAWMQDQMVQLGQLPKAGDIAKIVSPEIRAEAAKRIDK
jgi:ABC-type nitrate/sulfonate/bicarbonate transport system substrate-binding protein